MKISFKNITRVFKKTGRTFAFNEKNPVLFHWKLLLFFFVILFVSVGTAGIFLYRYFVLEIRSSDNSTEETQTLLDEKKLNEVVDRFEKKKKESIEMGTGTSRFIDPSIPF